MDNLDGPYKMKTKLGAYLTVKDYTILRLVADDQFQDENNTAPGVYILKNDNKMAFIFQRGEDRYYLKVDGNELTLVKEAYTHIDDSYYWFLRKDEGNGEHYSLKSEPEPDKYICQSNESQICVPGDRHKALLLTLIK